MVPLLFTIVTAVFINLSQAQICPVNGYVRLQDGPTQFEGRVEVCINGQWRTVCNDFWGHNEAQVVCRQLGFSTSGTETYIDLRITGGPDTGVDDTNCTGTEPGLLNCKLSFEVSDCSGNAHKVGVRCHEERKPRNLMLSFREEFLNIAWNEPDRGVTAEQVQIYNVECNFTQDTATYTLKHNVGRDVMQASLPITNALSDSGYHCCIEAVFETYSSKACNSLQTHDRLDSGTNAQQVLRISCPQNQVAPAVAGVLTPLILILLVALLVLILALVYTWKKMKSTKESDRQCVASCTTKDSALGSPTYGGQALDHDAISRRMPPVVHKMGKSSGGYSGDGPEYELVLTANPQKEHVRLNKELQTRANTTRTPVILQPAAYEVPVNSGSQTLP